MVQAATTRCWSKTISGPSMGATARTGHSGHHSVSTRGTDEVTPPEAAIDTPRHHRLWRPLCHRLHHWLRR